MGRNGINFQDDNEYNPQDRRSAAGTTPKEANAGVSAGEEYFGWDLLFSEID